MSQEGTSRRPLPFQFVSREPHLPGGVCRFTIWEPEYAWALAEVDRRGFENPILLPNGDTLVVRVHKEEELEDAASDRNARKVKRLQRDPEPDRED